MKTSNKSKTIIIPADSEEDYLIWVQDKAEFREQLNRLFEGYPEIFPPDFEHGFRFYGFCEESKKMPDIRIRRIQMSFTKAVYQVSPSFQMPYRVGRTQEVEKALYLRRWGVPYSALAYVFGRNGMYWYRMHTSLGKNSIVGTTVKSPDNLPEDLLFDEEHFNYLGEKAYAATTVGEGCILGLEASWSADEEGLTKAYGVCAEECYELKEDYQPKTGNTDGWASTQKAINSLYPSIQLILCFLHKWFSVARTIKKKSKEYWEIGERVWEVYRAKTWHSFSQRLRRLKEWAQSHVKSEKTRNKIVRLCKNKDEYKGGYEHEKSHRTSNALDRLMDHQDRMMYSTRGWHGHSESLRLSLRAMALLWNFHPYTPKAKGSEKYPRSPFEQLNGFQYHDNWLHNLLIASSLQRDRTTNRKR